MGQSYLIGICGHFPNPGETVEELEHNNKKGKEKPPVSDDNNERDGRERRFEFWA